MKEFVKNRSAMLADAAVCYRGEVGSRRSTGNPPFLLGGGVWGGCADGFGRFDSLDGEPTCFLWHKTHVEVGRDRLECRLPLLRFRYRFCLSGRELPLGDATVRDYSQTLDVERATVTTAFTLTDGDMPVARVSLCQFISLDLPNLMQNEFHVASGVAGLTLMVEAEMLRHCVSHHGVPIDYPCEKTTVGGAPSLRSITTRGKTTLTVLSPEASATYADERTLSLTFDCAPGTPEISGASGAPDTRNTPGTPDTLDAPGTTYTMQLALVNSREETSPEEVVRATTAASPEKLHTAHVAAWECFWETSFVDMGDRTLNAMRLHFLYAIRASEGGTPGVPLTPGGLGSTGLWPFEFPQDVAWMVESYLGMNHPELARGVAEHWRTILPQAEEFTHKYFKKPDGHSVGGAFFPWMCPAFDLSGMPAPPTDPPYANQLHNGAYPLFICYLYWKYTGDRDFLLRALPVARDAADFFADISSYDAASGEYTITFKPCMGQDEMGSFNRDNYICCLTSAAWTMEGAAEMFRAAGQTPDARWLEILGRGYCFDRLVVGGLLASYEGGTVPNPEQKHPAQLNSITLRPVRRVYDTPAFAETYRRRYEFCRGAKENFWLGWSLCSFLIASVRMKDRAGARRDFGMLRTNADTARPMLDRHGLQMLETSGCNLGDSYYITSMCMAVTAMTELFVQCFDGDCCDLFPVVLTEESAAFDRLLTSFGFTVSGEWNRGAAALALEVSRETEVTLRLGPSCDGEYVLTDADGRALGRFSDRALHVRLTRGAYRIVRV